MSLYGAFERLQVLGALSASSIVFSAAYTMFMFQKVAFGGSLSNYFVKSVPDLNVREFYILATLVIFTVLFGIYPAPLLDAIHYSVSTLIYNSDIPS
jgi:NADH-ubiquinone oxidoreductase chain 4